jgi:hypothetical protein
MPTIRDILEPGRRLWLKPLWRWRSSDGKLYPCISFGRRAVADEVASKATQGDLIVAVRILDKQKSGGMPGHISGVQAIVPSERRMTASYIPADVLEASRRELGREWPFAIGAARAWEVPGDHNASDICPVSRSAFARTSGELGIVPIVPEELAAVLDLPVTLAETASTAAARAALAASAHHRQIADSLASDLYAQRKAAALIQSESAREMAAYARTGRITDRDDVLAALAAQQAMCGICGGTLGTSPSLSPCVVLNKENQPTVIHRACRAAAQHSPASVFPEGGRQVDLREVGVRQRDPTARLIALGINLQRNGGMLCCDVCQANHLDHPGASRETQSRLFDVHHRVALETGPRDTSVESDLLVLCALCHRVAHS